MYYIIYTVYYNIYIIYILLYTLRYITHYYYEEVGDTKTICLVPCSSRKVSWKSF
jgi:hypothetical protein